MQALTKRSQRVKGQSPGENRFQTVGGGRQWKKKKKYKRGRRPTSSSFSGTFLLPPLYRSKTEKLTVQFYCSDRWSGRRRRRRRRSAPLGSATHTAKSLDRVRRTSEGRKVWRGKKMLYFLSKETSKRLYMLDSFILSSSRHYYFEEKMMKRKRRRRWRRRARCLEKSIHHKTRQERWENRNRKKNEKK